MLLQGLSGFMESIFRDGLHLSRSSPTPDGGHFGKWPPSTDTHDSRTRKPYPKLTLTKHVMLVKYVDMWIILWITSPLIHRMMLRAGIMRGSDHGNNPQNFYPILVSTYKIMSYPVGSFVENIFFPPGLSGLMALCPSK